MLATGLVILILVYFFIWSKLSGAQTDDIVERLQRRPLWHRQIRMVRRPVLEGSLQRFHCGKHGRHELGIDRKGLCVREQNVRGKVLLRHHPRHERCRDAELVRVQ